MRTMLVTGATGCVGRAVVAGALARDWQVRGLARHDAPTPVALHLADVRDDDSVARAAAGCDVIVHAAGWVHRKATTAADRGELWSSIVDGTRVVAHAAERAGARLVVISSTAVYGAASADEAPAPSTEYGRAKLAAEAVARGMCAAPVIVRPGTVFGRHDRGNVAALIDAVARGRALVVGSGTNRKTLVYADNLADRVVLAAERPSLTGIWIASDDPAPTQAEIATAIAAAIRVAPPRRAPEALLAYAARALDALTTGSGPRWRDRVKTLARDTWFPGAALDAELSYHPRVPWREAITAAVAWHRSVA
jgi:nucleoside-diphosphate-sugar epimerase